MAEIWKDIVGYEGLYQVSNLGRIKSFRKSSKFGKQSEFILNPSIINTGYESVTLYRSSRDRHKVLIHRLVAMAFIPNPDNLESVNHKDENKRNNTVENLEWCSLAYNNAYGTARIRQVLTKGRPVQQLTLEGYPLAIYNSVGIAATLSGNCKTSIKECCSGKQKSSGGYLWRYV